MQPKFPSRRTEPCPARMKCIRSKTGRLIERSIYAENYERNRKNAEEKEQLYRRRQAIVEHPFGTIKRQWGFSYILTREGKNRASADVGFIFIAYNIRRIISILDKDMFGEYLRILVSLFLTILTLLRRKISRFGITYFRRILFPVQINPLLISL